MRGLAAYGRGVTSDPVDVSGLQERRRRLDGGRDLSARPGMLGGRRSAVLAVARAPARADHRRASWIALVAATCMLGGCILAGWWLSRDGVDLHLGSAFPLSGQYGLHVGRWLLPCLMVGLAGWACGPSLVATLPWPRLLLAALVGSAAWAVALAAVAGPVAIAAPLTRQGEYLSEVGRVNAMGLGSYLDNFTRFIVGTGGTPEAPQWTTHVGGHPPLPTLLFALLARAGLAGPGWAAAVCITVGSCAAPAVLATLRAVAGEDGARRAAVFVVFAPTALWVATSADAIFAGVAAAGVCALAYSGAHGFHGTWGLAFAGGLALGTCLMLSYGLVLLAPIAAAAVLLASPRWSERITVLLIAMLGAVAVLASFAIAGFWWPDGLRLASQRVMSGPGWQDRPAAYFLFANPAAVAVAAGPAVVAALPLLGRFRWSNRHAALAVAALLAIAIAVASSLSKGEVERIYLPFTVWLLPLAALLVEGRSRGRASARGWLAAQIGWTILVAATTSLHW
jgi:methylthioxylose transferase